MMTLNPNESWFRDRVALVTGAGGGMGRIGGRHTLEFMSDLKTIVLTLRGQALTHPSGRNRNAASQTAPEHYNNQALLFSGPST